MKYVIKTTFALVAVVLLSISCITTKSVKVEALNTATTVLSPNRFVFYYPKTVLTFQVSCLHERFVPGPYANYSQKYIGVNSMNVDAKEAWRVIQVSITPRTEPDYLRLFSVEGAPLDIAKISRAIGSGSIFPSSAQGDRMETPIAAPEVFPRSTFLDMGVTPFISTKKSVFNTRVQVDSGFVRVPIQKNIVVEANLEDKAREAADFIFSIRKRRFDVISGDVEHAFDGNAMEVALAELSRLEEAYLSLFTGKLFTDTLSFQYSFVPTSATTQNSILFRFSEEYGVLSEDNLAGRPIMLELIAEKNQESLRILGTNVSTKEAVQFPYLFPEVCRLVLTDGKNTLLQQRIPVNQLGLVVFFPVSILE